MAVRAGSRAPGRLGAVSPARRPRWAAVRALVTDVDGVLTDGGLYYAESGDELKRFDVRDGQGLVLLREAGLLTAIVTRKQTTIVTRRARDLGIAEVHQNVTDKAAAIADLATRHHLAPAAMCYVGDDLGDLPALRAVGVAVAVADAVPEVRRAATYVTRARAGHGAVREVCDLILAARRRRSVSAQPDGRGGRRREARRPGGAAPPPRRSARRE
jgi:3-deoxy-D-manno-octulosonate 8-phosphate phosphatase (KDO 8-P phosphatase)